MAIKRLTLLFLCFIFQFQTEAQNTYFVSGSGSNSGSGTLTQPWQTIAYGVSMLQPGDTLYVRQGTYDGYFNIQVNGLPTNETVVSNYLNEQVIIDGSLVSANPSNPNLPNLVTIIGQHVVFKGFKLQFAANRSLVTGADYITLHSLEIRNGYGSGITVFQCSHNKIINCSIHDLYDYNDPVTGGGGGNSDGIKITAGNTLPYPNFGYTIVKNNIIYNISDDGIDTWSSRGNRIEANKVYHTGYTNAGNGFLGTLQLAAGDGNGYKIGGGGQSGQNVVFNNISFQNRYAGFDGNSGIQNKLYNNTSFDEPIGFRALGADYTLKNNLAYNNSQSIFTFASLYPTNSTTNSWELNISNPVFVSLNPNNTTFLTLNSSSPAVDAGVSLITEGVNTDYNGTVRPQGLGFDLGAFEFQTTLSTPETKGQKKYTIFPNPSCDFVFLSESENKLDEKTVSIYNHLGMFIKKSKISSTQGVDISKFQCGLYLFLFKDEQQTFRVLKH